jgi:hypothetical protein
MKLVQILLLILISHVTYGQIYIGGKDINKLEAGTLIQVEAQYLGAGLMSRLMILVDYGQKYEKGTSYSVTNEQGNEKTEFNTPVETLNFFLKNGWELVDFDAVIQERRLYTYLLKRAKQ